MRQRLRADDGSALVEFVYLSVLLMVPLVYVLVTVLQVQRAAFGVTEAARQSGRAYAQSASVQEGTADADRAMRLALADQGVTPVEPVELRCTPGPCSLSPGEAVRATVRSRVDLPVLGLLLGRVRPTIPVSAVHIEVVDRFRPTNAAP